MEELNRIKPDFFYAEVAKKTNVSKDIVEEIYTKFLNRVTELSKTESKIFIKGLGTFERHPNNIFSNMYTIANYVIKNPDIFREDAITERQLTYILRMEGFFSDLEKLKTKYKYVEKSIEKFWTNSGGLEEFFDDKGRVTKDFKIKEFHLSDVSFPLEECEEFE
jgi:nucleoid DNA-binding protein